MFEYDYLQAKLHGIHSKSIVGDNFEKIKKITSIERLKKEIFPEDNTVVPTNHLYSYLEKKVKEKMFKQINYISTFYKFKNKFINTLILRYEIDNVKLLLNAYYGKSPDLTDLFEVDLENTLNYDLIYKNDISDFKNLKKILKDTVFEFLIEIIPEYEDIFFIENHLDKFYYQTLLDSLYALSKHEKDLLSNIIIEEMNWQNLTWAFRTKVYYKKSFANVKDTFLDFKNLIPLDVLNNIFELQFIPDEAELILKDIPIKYRSVILESFNEDGDFDLPLLEDNNLKELMKLYSKYFFIENFNILPIISFVYIKKIEYYNIVKLIESIRYNIRLETA